MNGATQTTLKGFTVNEKFERFITEGYHLSGLRPPGMSSYEARAFDDYAALRHEHFAAQRVVKFGRLSDSVARVSVPDFKEDTRFEKFIADGVPERDMNPADVPAFRRYLAMRAARDEAVRARARAELERVNALPSEEREREVAGRYGEAGSEGRYLFDQYNEAYSRTLELHAELDSLRRRTSDVIGTPLDDLIPQLTMIPAVEQALARAQQETDTRKAALDAVDARAASVKTRAFESVQRKRAEIERLKHEIDIVDQRTKDLSWPSIGESPVPTGDTVALGWWQQQRRAELPAERERLQNRIAELAAEIARTEGHQR